MDKKLTAKQRKALKARVEKVKPEDEERVKRDYKKAAAKAKARGASPGLMDEVKTLW